MSRWVKTVLVMSFSLIPLVGCGSGKADENKPVSEVRAEAEEMGVEELQKMAEAYRAAIEAKKPEIEALKAKLKEIPLTELLGEEAKSLKADTEKLNDSVKALKERLDIYVEELKKQNVDVN